MPNGYPYNSDRTPFSDSALQKMFARRVADLVAERGLELAAWDDGMYADGQPDPITGSNARLVDGIFHA